MKSANYIINGVLAVAVIILFILQFSGKKGNKEDQPVITGDSTTVRLPIAYVNTDTLIQNYKYAIELTDAHMSKMESIKATLSQREQSFTAELLEFRRKYENNAFLSAERMQQEQDRLTKKQQDLENYAARTQEDFTRETLKMNQQLSDTVISLLKVFNQSSKYQVIFNNSGADNILIADDVYDITSDVLEFLNSKYVSSPSDPTK